MTASTDSIFENLIDKFSQVEKDKNKNVDEGQLTEGQFSWYASDTNEPIYSTEGHQTSIWMIDDKGNKWEEEMYEGYGVFGGKDYYELLAEMNGLESDRAVGIDAAFADFSEESIKFPKLVSDPNVKYEDVPVPRSHENQGWWEDEGEDEHNEWDDDGREDEEEGMGEKKVKESIEQVIIDAIDSDRLAEVCDELGYPNDVVIQALISSYEDDLSQGGDMGSLDEWLSDNLDASIIRDSIPDPAMEEEPQIQEPTPKEDPKKGQNFTGDYSSLNQSKVGEGEGEAKVYETEDFPDKFMTAYLAEIERGVERDDAIRNALDNVSDGAFARSDEQEQKRWFEKFSQFIETSEVPDSKVKEEVDESIIDEKKAVPVCKKCSKKHWPFQKCGSKVKEEVEDEVPESKGDKMTVSTDSQFENLVDRFSQVEEDENKNVDEDDYGVDDRDEYDDAAQKESSGKPVLKLVGEDGNAFSILGRASKAAKRAGWSREEIDKFMEVAKSGDYNNLLQTCMEYFDTDSDEDEEDDDNEFEFESQNEDLEIDRGNEEESAVDSPAEEPAATLDIGEKDFDAVQDIVGNGGEGLVVLGAGGDPQDWVNGIIDLWHEEGIFEGTAEEAFSEIFKLTSTGGRTDLVMVFDDSASLDMGKMAMWRLRFGSCSWISDFVHNYASHYGGEDWEIDDDRRLGDDSEAEDNERLPLEDEFESIANEKKATPVCKKCSKKHWPFKKCGSKVKEEVDEQLTPRSDDILYIAPAHFGEGWSVLTTSEGSNQATVVFKFVSEEAADAAALKIADAIGGEYRGKEDPRVDPTAERSPRDTLEAEEVDEAGPKNDWAVFITKPIKKRISKWLPQLKAEEFARLLTGIETSKAMSKEDAEKAGITESEEPSPPSRKIKEGVEESYSWHDENRGSTFKVVAGIEGTKVFEDDTEILDWPVTSHANILDEYSVADGFVNCLIANGETETEESPEDAFTDE